MRSTPAISVVIPMFNSERTIASAISSVLAQSCVNWELIVVDDGSTDSGYEIVRKFNDSRIICYRQCNAGVSSARNLGVEKATTNIIAFLDSDDTWQPEFLESMLELASAYPQCGVLASFYWFRYQGSAECARPILPKELGSTNMSLLKHYFDLASRGDPLFNTSSVAVRRSAFESVGGFPLGIKGGEDLLTWARLALVTDIGYCAKPLAIYNVADLRSRQIRTLPDDDPVGEQLINLLNQAPEGLAVPGLRSYIGHWYKIRASTYLSRGFSEAGRAYTKRAVLYSGPSVKLTAYYFISLLPRPVSGLIFRFFLASVRLMRKDTS